MHDLVIAEHSDREDEDDDGHDHSVPVAAYGYFFNIWKLWDSDVTTRTVKTADDEEHSHSVGVPYNASRNVSWHNLRIGNMV